MAGREVIVDGYNVIRADENLSRLEDRSLEEARDALVRALASSPRFVGDRVVVVFDGSSPRATSGHFGSVTVVFSDGGQSADDLIRARALASIEPRNTIVVTNDRDVRDYCEGLGCTGTSSENLLRQMRLPTNVRPPRMQPRPESTGPAILGGAKKGNPKRSPKRTRNRQDVRF